MVVKKFHLDRFCTQLRISQNVDAKHGLQTIRKLLSLVHTVKLEILENASVLTDSQRSFYFSSIVQRLLQEETLIKSDKDEIKFFLKKFNTTLKDIESNTIDNERFKNLLDLYINPYKTDDKTIYARALQLAFVRYYSTMCIQRVMQFCEAPLLHSDSTKTNHTVQEHPEEFRSVEALHWFENALYERNVLSKEGIKKRGFAAVAHAVFLNSDCKNYILKSNLRLSEFITFLNREYSAEVKSQKSLSDGTNHELYIVKQIGNFKARHGSSE